MKPYVYIAALLLAMAGIVGAAAYIHHQGYAAGVASMQGKLDAATKQVAREQAERDAAIAQSQADDAAVAQVKQQLDANAAAQAQVDVQAAQAVNAARANAADADRALKAWMDRYAQALRDPDCNKPMSVLCPQLRAY